MAETVISVEGVGKRYFLRHRERFRGLRHVVQDALTFKSHEKGEEFWALKNVSFEARQGEVLGIVGRNGAGKSTLLKILSRITEPTLGKIRLRGRVGSLLEVGTGFHGELTGRENIFLNGAILGMRRAEIQRKFDDIVAFAEVEQFLDTPVKRYSSGMHVRLGFAVAAHLEPEILVVDEVLAVGDAQFQKKCLGKMESVARGEGRTILFVSHNMGAVSQLCTRALLLERGQIVREGKVEEIIAHYLGSGDSGGIWKLGKLDARKKIQFRRLSLLNHLGQTTADLDVRFPFSIHVEFEIPSPLRRVDLAARILTADGRAVMTTLLSELSPEEMERERAGKFRASVKFPGMFLMPGAYLLNIAAHEPMGEVFDLVEGAISFVVRDSGTVFSKYPNPSGIGIVMQSLPWEVEKDV